MKRIGLIGGTTWVSTAEYYADINRMANERQGGLDFADCVLVSLNLGLLRRNTHADNKPLLVQAALDVKAAGAKAIVLCANTMHMHVEAVEAATGLPLIHVAVETAKAITAQGLNRVALLGTLATMEMPFYRETLAENGVETLIPDEEDRAFIERTIFEELAQEIFTAETKARYLRIISDLVAQGAQGAILGCTELPLLIAEGDAPVPTFNTARIHAKAAVDFMLSDN